MLTEMDWKDLLIFVTMIGTWRMLHPYVNILGKNSEMEKHINIILYFIVMRQVYLLMMEGFQKKKIPYLRFLVWIVMKMTLLVRIKRRPLKNAALEQYVEETILDVLYSSLWNSGKVRVMPVEDQIRLELLVEVNLPLKECKKNNLNINVTGKYEAGLKAKELFCNSVFYQETEKIPTNNRYLQY